MSSTCPKCGKTHSFVHPAPYLEYCRPCYRQATAGRRQELSRLRRCIQCGQQSMEYTCEGCGSRTIPDGPWAEDEPDYRR